MLAVRRQTSPASLWVSYALMRLALPGYLSHGAFRASAQVTSWLACAAMPAFVGTSILLRKGRMATSRAFILSIGLRECRGFSCRNKKSQAGLGRWLRLLMGFRLDHNQQYDPNHGEHAKRGCLAVPRRGLPHQKPFASHSEKGHQPHQQT